MALNGALTHERDRGIGPRDCYGFFLNGLYTMEIMRFEMARMASRAPQHEIRPSFFPQGICFS